MMLEVEEGETYDVRCSIGAGFVAGPARLTRSTKAEFAAKAKGLTLWTRAPAP